jgi:hypothetical protein
MTERRDPDRLIEAYFALPATELPDRAFDAIRRDVHRTRQRLVLGPWREPETRLLALVVPIAAVVVLLVGAWHLGAPGVGPGGIGGSTPAPTPTVFRSPLYGYAVVLPDGWTATPAFERWDGVTQPSIGPEVDQLAGPKLVALGLAGPFAGDLAAFSQDRVAAAARDHADTCLPDAFQGSQPITIGGQSGALLTWNCGALIDQAVTVRDGIAYAFTLRDVAFAATLDPTDLASFRTMLGSLTFPTAPTESP